MNKINMEELIEFLEKNRPVSKRLIIELGIRTHLLKEDDEKKLDKIFRTGYFPMLTTRNDTSILEDVSRDELIEMFKNKEEPKNFIIYSDEALEQENQKNLEHLLIEECIFPEDKKNVIRN